MARVAPMTNDYVDPTLTEHNEDTLQPSAPREPEFIGTHPGRGSIEGLDLPSLGEYNIPPQQALPYHDIASVPHGCLLSYGEAEFQRHGSSPAETSPIKKGIETHDKLLDKDDRALWHFFLTQCDAQPRMKIQIQGYHVVRHTHHTKHGTRTTYRHITDFDFVLHFSHLVPQEFKQVFALSRWFASGEKAPWDVLGILLQCK